MRALLRRFGYDLNRYPYPESLEGHLVRILPTIQTVVDVGAHEGEFGHLCRGLGFAGEIHSFEPIATVKGTDERWTVHAHALGSEKGTVQMGTAGTMSSILVPDLRSLADSGLPGMPTGTKMMEVRRLDSYEFDGLLKTDCQGFDLEVLRGAPLTNFTALLFEGTLVPQYEDQPLLGELVAYVTDRGFSVTGLYPVIRDKWGRLLEVDVIAERVLDPT